MTRHSAVNCKFISWGHWTGFSGATKCVTYNKNKVSEHISVYIHDTNFSFSLHNWKCNIIQYGWYNHV